MFDKQKYDTEYARQNYDRCIFNVPKGQKIVIEEHWKAKGYKSLNAYVNDLIRQDMNQEPAEQKSIQVQNSHGFIIGDNNGTINM